jgi:hypothetical protein
MGSASSSLLAGRCWKLCTEAWPQYALGDQEKWPSQGSLNYNTILQLDLFYKSKKVNWGPLYKFLPSKPPQYSEPLNECFSLQQTMVGRGQVLCPLPVIRPKGNLKTSKQLYWCPDKYIQAFSSVIQTFQLTWKDILLLLDQTLISLEKQWVLAQATQVGNDYMAQAIECRFTSRKSWVQVQYSQSKK